MRKLSMIVAAVALAFACNANAQQFDGTWAVVALSPDLLIGDGPQPAVA